MLRKCKNFTQAFPHVCAHRSLSASHLVMCENHVKAEMLEGTSWWTEKQRSSSRMIVGLEGNGSAMSWV